MNVRVPTLAVLRSFGLHCRVDPFCVRRMCLHSPSERGFVSRRRWVQAHPDCFHFVSRETRPPVDASRYAAYMTSYKLQSSRPPRTQTALLIEHADERPRGCTPSGPGLLVCIARRRHAQPRPFSCWGQLNRRQLGQTTRRSPRPGRTRVRRALASSFPFHFGRGTLCGLCFISFAFGFGEPSAACWGSSYVHSGHQNAAQSNTQSPPYLAHSCGVRRGQSVFQSQI